jgi:hypothetical protein
MMGKTPRKLRPLDPTNLRVFRITKWWSDGKPHAFYVLATHGWEIDQEILGKGQYEREEMAWIPCQFLTERVLAALLIAWPLGLSVDEILEGDEFKDETLPFLLEALLFLQRQGKIQGSLEAGNPIESIWRVLPDAAIPAKSTHYLLTSLQP